LGSGAASDCAAPTATLAPTATVLLTDIEDSTSLWERYPSEMEAVVNQHDDLVASIVAARRGRIVKSTGDGSLAVFEDAPDAVAAAVEIQRTIPTLQWPGIGMLRVRIGMDTGVCRFSRRDVLGRPPNLAARLQSAGHGAQVLASHATATASVGGLADDVELRDLGPFLMRGFDAPVRVHQVVAAGMRDDFPPLRAPAPGLDDLPPDDFELFGRDGIIDDLSTTLSGRRLVTLWGPAGVGKTSIAARVARAARRRFDDGMWFVDLSSVADAPGAWQALVAAMHAQPASGEDARATALRCLRPARAAVILDNCETALDGVRELVEDVLSTCRTTHVLTTSRQPLGTESELPIEIEPLPTPTEADRRPADLLAFPSVQLFVARLTASRPWFVLDETTADAVAGLCRRADGLPLALDLAAARATVTGLTVETALPEQLQSALSRTFAALSTDEMRLFVRLATFSGPFTRELARAIAPFAGNVDGALDRLVHMAVVQRETSDVDRYRLLMPMREFCWDRLDAREQQAAASAHALVMVGRAEHHRGGLRSAMQATAVEAVASEFTEYRAALGCLLGNGAYDEAARLVVALFQYCLFQPRPEGQSWARTVSEHLTGAEPFAAEIFGAAALGAWYGGDMRAALDLGSRSLDAADAAGGATIWARTALLNAHGYAGDLDAVVPHFLALVDESHRSPDPYWQISGFAYEAISLSMFGQSRSALERAERAIGLARDLGNGDALHWAFHALGRALVEQDPVGSCEAYEQAMAFARQVGSGFCVGLDLVEWVDIKRRLGELALARAGADDLLGLLAVSGNRSQLSQALRQAGLVLAAIGQPEVAAIALLARRGLPAMPTGADTAVADEQVLAQLEADIGDSFPRLRVRARALSEPSLIDLCRTSLAP
jgi:predicted ATPase/class 3 adenylate cyclase